MLKIVFFFFFFIEHGQNLEDYSQLKEKSLSFASDFFVAKPNSNVKRLNLKNLSFYSGQIKKKTFLFTQNMLKHHNHKVMINMACILKATKAKVGRYITHAMPSFFHSSEVGSK